MKQWLQTIREHQSLLKTIVFYIIFALVILFVVVGLFLLLIWLILPFRSHIPYRAVPWLYGSLYILTAVISYFFLKHTHKKAKDFLFPSTQSTHKENSSL